MSKHDREILVGVGDSSFCQLPCPWTPSWRELHGDCSSIISSSISVQPKISQIACGAAMALAVLAVEGNNVPPPSLMEWGTGLYGERLSPEASLLENNEHNTADPTPANHPTRPFSIPPLGLCTAPPAIRHIACGAHFVVASLQAGGCVSWGGGRDASRVLGRGGCGSCDPCCARGKNRSTPVAAPSVNPTSSRADGSKPSWLAKPLGAGGSQVNSLAAGDDHTIAVCADGSAWAWGRGDCGQLGCGADIRSSCVPLAVRVVSYTTAAAFFCAPMAVKKTDGSERHEVSQSPPEATKVIAAACGRDHSAVLTKDGRVWTFGSGLHGQLGLGTVGEMSWTPAAVESLEGVGTMRQDGSFTGIASVACGAWHTAALSTIGDVYAWGWRRHGALGPSPTQHIFGKRADSVSLNNGSAENDTGDRRTIAKTSSTAAAAAGAAREEGEVRPYPGLVDGLDDLLADDGDDQLVSVSCGARYTLAVSRKKRAFVWGQVAPAKDHQSLESGDGTGSGSHHTAKGGKGTACEGDRSPLRKVPFFCPRELRPGEILRDNAAAAAAAPRESPGGGERCRCCPSAGGSAAVERGSGISEEQLPAEDVVALDDSEWRVSAVGCGPWYVVLGLEETSRQGATRA